ncbi:MAG: hypothetical protein HQM15_11960 [Deltaproteobacteria bacterium]|nr:hypothetical protein [Deltaproteobacteria bacterium]
MLHARVRKVDALFEKPGPAETEKKEAVRLELSQIQVDLGRVLEAKRSSEVSGIVSSNVLEVPVSSLAESANTDAAQVEGAVVQSTAETIEQRIAGLNSLNRLVAEEIERTAAANQEAFEQNKSLKEKLNTISKLHEEAKERLREIQNKAANTQVEYNKVLLEIQFLMGEKNRTVQYIEGEYEHLASMAKRYELLKRNFEFTRGEAGVSENMLGYLEVLLGHVRGQKKELIEKVESSEKSMQDLLDDLNRTIKNGKMLYYDKVAQSGGSSQ